MKTKFPASPRHATPKIDLAVANRQLRGLSAKERIDWAFSTFGASLYAMTSAGIDSALMLEHIAQTGQPIQVIHINTGFLPPETLAFRGELEQIFGLQFHDFSPSQKQIDDIIASKLWDIDLAAYSQITKLEPLKKAIRQLSVGALLSGVRSDQTANRSTLEYIGLGNDGEYRIHPFIDWPAAKVASYIDNHGLPRNALYDQGFGSAGDRNTTRPGKGRAGRLVMECGLHVVDGKLVSNRN